MPNPVIVRRLGSGGQAASLAASLGAYWTLDANVAGQVLDATTNGLNLNINGGFTGTFPVALINRGFEAGSFFDGITLTEGTKLVAGAGKSFTFQVWSFYNDSTNGQPLGGRASTGGGGAYDFLLSTNDGAINARLFRFDTSNAVGLTTGVTFTGVTITNGVWYHVVCGYDFSLQQIWIQVNGGTRQTLGPVTDVANLLPTFSLGNFADLSNASSTTLDECAFWNRSLGSAEVIALYNGGAGQPFSKLNALFSNTNGSPSRTRGQVWSTVVVSKGGAAPSVGTVSALDTFYSGLISNSLTSSVVAFNAVVPDNLVAALTPFIQGPGLALWTNNNFVLGDLTVNGLAGDGVTKYLDTGIRPAAPLTSTSAGLVCYVFDNSSIASSWLFGVHDSAPANNSIAFLPSQAGPITTAELWSFAGATNFASAAKPASGGYFSMQRTSASILNLYFANSGNVHSSLAATGSAQTGAISSGGQSIYAFALNNVGSAFGFSTCRVSSFAVTTGLSSAQDNILSGLVQQLRTSLGGGFI